MIKEHVFKYSVEQVFEVLEKTIKEEVQSVTDKWYNSLEGISYKRQGTVSELVYKIVRFDIKSGYKLEVTEPDNTCYTLKINLEELDGLCKLTYINEMKTTKKLKQLNYKISLFFFKKRVVKRYLYFINYLESKLEENYEKNFVSM